MELHEPPDVPRLSYVGAWFAERAQHAAPHRHTGWKITYYRSGRIDSIVDGVRYRVAPGDVLVLPSRAVHEEIAHTAYSNYYLVVEAPQRQPWPARCQGEASHDIGWLLGRLLRETSVAGDERAPEIAALLKLIDSTLRRAHSEGRSTRADLVRLAEAILEERYATRLTIGEVAREVGLSVSALRQRFAAERGISPQTALHQVRLRHALTLLGNSDLTLAAIAERCGYASASHLSRHVRSATGSSPGRLR